MKTLMSKIKQIFWKKCHLGFISLELIYLMAVTEFKAHTAVFQGV